jgi:hypothetical protein
MTVGKQKSIHGLKAFVADKNDILVGRGGVAAGGNDKPTVVIPGSPTMTAVFEDFHGYVQDTGTGYFIDTGSAAGAPQGLTNGVLRITTTAVDVDDPHVVRGRTLGWKVNQGPGGQSGSLRYAARIKKSSYTLGYQGIFCGFTDATATEMPFHDTGGAAGTADKATATDGFGIMWNASGANSGAGWVGVAVDGDAYQDTGLTNAVPTANRWYTLEMEAHRGLGDTGGTVTFYIDGAVVGSIDNPCNTSTALVPVVAVYDTGGAGTIDIDYIAVSAPRDTGT